jgi:16S rRNA (guanine(966)-N(2))-methyltransferase RsmD
VRIIAGEFRRRVLQSPPGQTTRPIPDRLKESLFSMLGQRVDGAQVLDLFAGSGAIGLEALSRGAAACTFVEMDKRSGATLQANIDLLACQRRAKVILGDALGLSILARVPRPLDLVFMDPPYPLIETPAGWQRVTTFIAQLAPLLSDTGFIILRTPHPHILEEPAIITDAAQRAGGPVPRRNKRHTKPRKSDWNDRTSTAKSAAANDDDHEDSSADENGQWFLGDNVNDLQAQVKAATPLPPTTGPQPIRTPASHDIPTVRGPETHRFGSMSVHFYMRQP